MARLKPDAPFFHDNVTATDCQFGSYVEIGEGSRLLHVDLGDYSYCDRYADMANATIGKFANIASFTRIGATDHPLTTASLHHFLYRSADYWDDVENDEVFFEHRKSRRAYVGHDTWIGHGAIIKPEVQIADGAVVASGAIVTKDVGPYEIVAGAPAVLLRLRQPREIAERIIDLAWWDWSHARLRETLMDFRAMPVADFLDKYETR
jgi:phosphonate metabolism protein (transferase hexapeptide repeat family)